MMMMMLKMMMIMMMMMMMMIVKMMIVKMMMVMVTMTICFAALWKEHFTGAFGSKREALISPQNIQNIARIPCGPWGCNPKIGWSRPHVTRGRAKRC